MGDITKDTCGKTVKLTLDSENLPQLTDQQLDELAAVALMHDDAIDYSDASEMHDLTGFRPAALRLGD